MENKVLFKQQIELKNIMSDSFIYPNLNSKEEVQITDQDDYFLRDDSLQSGTVFFGPLSWVSMVGTEKSSISNDKLLYSFQEAERFNYDQTKVKVIKKVTSQPDFCDLRKSIVTLNINSHHINKPNYKILFDMLNEIVSKLPNFKTIKLLLAAFFHEANFQKLLVDEKRLIKSFHSLFSISADNQSFKLKNISENQIINALAKLSLILNVLAFPMMSQYYNKKTNPKFKNTNSPENFMLLYKYSDMIITTLYSFTKTVHDLPIDYLFSLLLLSYALSYLPFGDRYDDNGALNRDRLHILVSLARIFRLNEDVDSIYCNETPVFRACLKQLWNSLCIMDYFESFEMGLPTLISSTEIANQMKLKWVDTLIFLNRSLDKFTKLEASLQPLKLVEFVENDLIYEAKTINYLYYDSIEVLLKDLELCKDSASLFRKVLEIIGHILTSLLIQSLYALCLRKIKKYSQEFSNLSVPYDLLLKKFKILTIKYSFLCVTSNVRLLQSFQKIINQSPCTYALMQLNVMSAIFVLYMPIISIFRRGGVSIGANILDDPLFNGNASASGIRTGGERYLENVPEFYSIRDLEDRRIDNDITKLLGKFQDLLDVKFILFNLYKMMSDFVKYLQNDQFNFDFLKNNFACFHIIKLTTSSLNELYQLNQAAEEAAPPAPAPAAKPHTLET